MLSGSTLSAWASSPPLAYIWSKGIALYDPRSTAPAFLYGEDPGVVCRIYAPGAVDLGYPDQALARSHEALTWRSSVRTPLASVLP